MRIAILGSTSQIAIDLAYNLSSKTDFTCILYSRNPETQKEWVKSTLNRNFIVKHLSDFSNNISFDLIINFIGISDQKKAKILGKEVLYISNKYDELCLEYLKYNPHSRYIFISSGAVYGDSFRLNKKNINYSCIDINNIDNLDWYGISKIYAELNHRYRSEFKIYDLRVFGYFSPNQDLKKSFLMTDIVNAILLNKTIECDSTNIVRDYISADDFFNIITIIINNSHIDNQPFDCYSSEPIDKMSILKFLSEDFGLKYSITNKKEKNEKQYYYSRSKKLQQFGYIPNFSSLDTIVNSIKVIINS